MNCDRIIENIGQLVTCASSGPKRGSAMLDVGIIEDAAVAIANGEFVGVGPGEEIRQRFESEEVVDAEGSAACPGFVDPHTHIVFGGDRLNEFELKIKGAEYLEILENGGGIISTVRMTREASVDQLILLAAERLYKMMLSGTTTCEIKTGYGLDTETELKMLGVIQQLDRNHAMDIVPTFLPAHAFPPEFRDDPDSYVALVCEEMLPLAKKQLGEFTGQIFVDVFCEKGAFSLEQSTLILRTAKELGFGLKAHVDEFTNLGGSRMAIELGAVSIDHLDAISDEEVEMLAASDTMGVVTPTVNFNFGSTHYADARKLIDSGCAIALSTDYNPGSAPCPSQPMAMAIACRYQKLLPSEVFNAATINAAYAIGRGDKVGSIEVGKSADILLLDCEDYRLVANEFGGNLVSNVFKKGKKLVYGPR